MNKKNRKTHLEELRRETRTMLFYEAPHKLLATLSDLLEVFGPERRISLCRELTKLHEEIRRTNLGEAFEWYKNNQPKGEFVLVMEGTSPQQEDKPTLEVGLERVFALRAAGASLKDATRQAAAELGLSRNRLYEQAVEKNG